MPRTHFAIGVAVVVSALAVPAVAQDEEALRSFLEGQRVSLRIDMPATSDGVDVHADSSRPLDAQSYGNRLKTYGAAIRAGESSTVTLVKMKRDLIEIQLDGGGFGTFGDDTSTPYIPHVEKSSREKELERRVKDEDDPARRRRLERELDDLREERDRENRRIDRERAIVEERKKEVIAEKRLHAGSRFNLRYDRAVPAGLRPAEVMAALADYVEFSSARLPLRAERIPLRADRIGPGWPRKGMTRADAERELGPALDARDRREGGLTVTTLTFTSGGEHITAEFVEDVLIRFSATSR